MTVRPARAFHSDELFHYTPKRSSVSSEEAVAGTFLGRRVLIRSPRLAATQWGALGVQSTEPRSGTCLACLAHLSEP